MGDARGNLLQGCLSPCLRWHGMAPSHGEKPLMVLNWAFGELVPMLPPALRLPDSGCCPGQDEAGKPRRNVPTGVA